MRLLITVSALLVLSSCGSGPEKQGQSAAAPAASAPKPKPKPSAEPMLFPKKDRVSTDVQESPLFGNPVLPAGNVAHYKAGRQEFDLFHVKTKSGLDAAILLSDYKSKLTDSKVVPGFGGFFGQDGGVPVFVFVKNEYLLGVRGLAEKDADRISREFASLVR